MSRERPSQVEKGFPNQGLSLEFFLGGSREPLKVIEHAVKPAPGVTEPKESELSLCSFPTPFYPLPLQGWALGTLTPDKT